MHYFPDLQNLKTNLNNTPVRNILFAGGALAGIWGGRKVCSAAAYKFAAKVADYLDKKDLSEYLGQKSNDYLIQAKKDLPYNLQNVLSCLLTSLVFQNEKFGDFNILKRSLGLMTLIKTTNCGLKIVRSGLCKIGDAALPRVMDKKSAEEWNQASKDYWNQFKKEFKSDIQTAAALFFSSGIAHNAHLLETEESKSFLLNTSFFLSAFLGKKIILSAGCKISSLLLGLIGKESAEEWNQASKDYFIQAKEDFLNDLILTELLMLFAIQLVHIYELFYYPSFATKVLFSYSCAATFFSTCYIYKSDKLVTALLGQVAGLLEQVAGLEAMLARERLPRPVRIPVILPHPVPHQGNR